MEEITASLVIGISARSLFNLEDENTIFEKKGIEAYTKFQLEHEDDLLKPGTAFPLIKALLRLNSLQPQRLVEVIVMSKNSPDTGLRVFNSIRNYDLDITRAAFSSGAALTHYLASFKVDLYLSKSEVNVQACIDAGFAAALIYDPPDNFSPETNQIRIAFDADAVIFSGESEQIYKEQGVAAFIEHEKENAYKPLQEGPFAKLLKTLSYIQSHLKIDPPPIRIAIVTSRNSPAHERVIRTLRAWNVRVDEAFFLGGISKHSMLQAFKAHIFFDDQHLHLDSAARVVPSARVLSKREYLDSTIINNEPDSDTSQSGILNGGE